MRQYFQCSAFSKSLSLIFFGRLVVIAIDPGRRSGKACLRGTRITVYDVLDYIASGMSQEEILADFPDLTETDVRACLAFTADGERRFEIVTT